MLNYPILERWFIDKQTKIWDKFDLYNKGFIKISNFEQPRIKDKNCSLINVLLIHFTNIIEWGK